MIIRNVHAITYSSGEYEGAKVALGMSAIKKGFNSFYCFSRMDLDSQFLEKNSATLLKTRGAGYWIWKPYILQVSSHRLKSNDVIMYLDAGVLPRFDSDFYYNLIEDDRIHVWIWEKSVMQEWTDPIIFDALKLPSSAKLNPMIMAGVILSKNTIKLQRFTEYWLALCENSDLLRPETFDGYIKKSPLIWHRHDQSILTAIVYENPEWFVVHSDASDGMSNEHVFDIHRNGKLKHIFLIPVFPKLRIFRRQIMQLLPAWIRRYIRNMRTIRGGKVISNLEIQSLNEKY